MSRANLFQKNLDRYFLPLVLKLYSLFRRQRTMPANIKRVGILKENTLGDLVLVSSLTGALKKNRPDIEIILFTTTGNKLLAPYLPGVDYFEIISLANLFKTKKIISRFQLDVLIDAGSWPRINAFIAALTRVATVGFRSLNQNRHFCYDYPIEHSNQIHENENYLRLLEPFGLFPKQLPALKLKNFQAIEGLPSTSYVVFHPWAAGVNYHLREWGFDNWKQLAFYFLKKSTAVVITGSPGESQKVETLITHINEKTGRGQTNIINFAKQAKNFEETLRVLKNAKQVFSVNTGVMHIAAALGVPTIGLSGPTNPLRWGPLGKHTISVHPQAADCGFLHFGFEYQGQKTDCMQLISTEQVIKMSKSIK